MFILSYVDGLLIIGEESEVNAFITNISKKDSQKVRFSHRDLNDGELHEISQSTQNLVFRIAPSAWRSSRCIELHAYCDLDWDGCPVNRKSTTGVVCQLWGTSIVHYSSIQATVAQSSAGAELYALTSAASDLIHLQSVIIEMEIVKSAEGIKLHVHTDSASSKAMVGKLGMSRKSKHIELRHLHLHGLVGSGIISA
eukprot:2600380-Amphidinium_carterae.2